MSYIVYTKQHCPNCDIVKAIFEANGVEFSSVLIGQDMEMDSFKEKFPSVRAVPFITTNTGDVVGGIQDVRKIFA